MPTLVHITGGSWKVPIQIYVCIIICVSTNFIITCVHDVCVLIIFNLKKNIFSVHIEFAVVEYSGSAQ